MMMIEAPFVVAQESLISCTYTPKTLDVCHIIFQADAARAL